MVSIFISIIKMFRGELNTIQEIEKKPKNRKIEIKIFGFNCFETNKIQMICLKNDFLNE